ncbi:MAG: polysaccharide biosynthesis/export family protein, partial [Planctomycetaceae bacterium]|nr:polysaccharide biosynthesis/export family protein [Planctomycetaceae bacterium]
LSTPREGARQLDPSLLVRSRPDQHRVEGGDILSIYIPRVLGSLSSEVTEVGISPPINLPASPDDPPTVGFPIQVRDDHTISLPQIAPLNVKGMTLQEVEDAIRHAYTVEHKILQADEAMVLVSLFRPREYRVLIFRQEFGQQVTPQTGAGSIAFGPSRKGTAREVRLKVGQNDVAHALTLAGVDGLPGNDAENTIYIIRHPKNRKQVSAQETCRPIPQHVDPQPAPQSFVPQNSLPVVPGYPAPPISNFSTSSTTNTQAGREVILASAESVEPNDVLQADYAYPDQEHAARPVSHVQLAGHSIASERPANSYGSPDLSSLESGETQYPMSVSLRSGPSQAIPGFPNTVRQQPVAAAPIQPVARQPVPAEPVIQQAANYDVELTANSSVQQMLAPFSNDVSQPATEESEVAAWPQHPVALPAARTAMLPPAPELVADTDGAVDANLWNNFLASFDPTIDSPHVIKIPVRVQPGQGIQFTEEDITLLDGDIVFIESRQTEVFYTGGLLGGGQYPIPRDYDLHVLEAVSIAESRNGQQAGQTMRTLGGVSALNQDVGGSASRVLIIRKLPNGQRARIEVNIYKAMVRDEENILIQPGDMLVLQYTFPEACAAFTQRFLLEGALIGIATSTFTGGGGGGGGGGN